MSTIRKTINFFISFFIAIVFMSLLSYIISPFISKLSNETVSNIVYPIFFTLIFVTFTLIQALLRYLHSKKILKENTVLLSVKAEQFRLGEKLWFYGVIILIYFAPLLKNLSLEYINWARVVLFIASIIVFEFLLKYSSETVKIHFMRNGILVSGFDIRINLPIAYNTEIHNDSGYYSYNDVDSYFIFPNHVELFLILEQGRLVFNADNEIKRQITGLLKQKKIKMRKYL
ncbi:hypothetical protein [Thermohalobacter berrensis]|uniref:DUF5673 domain-containing protein n=1 Tax=Thermohalobacter berrensis TaxID=99594 RepID=A0A419SXX6_9FIRM|nr:hypothetical protein [Thermohalobacter berrensis]RKD30107.1 hypothetical protein BET03_05220 [Thermohalobacter berrensis]